MRIVLVYLLLASIASANCSLIKVKEHWRDAEDSIYQTYEQRQQYKVTIEEGKLLKASGEVLHTLGAYNGLAKYVLAKDGQLYATTKHIPTRFEHNALVSDEDIIVAGNFMVRGGQLILINDYSPCYYSRNRCSLNTFLDFLEAKGINLSSVNIRYSLDTNTVGE